MGRFVAIADKSVSIVVALFALTIFVAQFGTLGLPDRWLYQALGLWLAYCVVATGGGFASSPITCTGLWAIRLGLIVLLGFPVGLESGVEYLLMASLLVDVGRVSSRGHRFAVYAVTGATTFAFQRPGLAWQATLGRPGTGDAAIFVASFAVVIILVEVLRRYRDDARVNGAQLARYEESIDALTEAMLEHQESAMRVMEKAIADDRRFLVREIHDTIGHAMVNIMMLSESLIDATDTRDAKDVEMIQTIRDETERTISETERILRDARTANASTGFALSDLKRLARLFSSSTGTDVRFEYRNMPATLGPRLDRVLYRLVQEALTNSVRHGKATAIDVMFWVQDGSLEVVIEDNGKGATEIHEGIGLWGIREQLSPIGGQLFFGSTPTGFRLRATMPYGTGA